MRQHRLARKMLGVFTQETTINPRPTVGRRASGSRWVTRDAFLDHARLLGVNEVLEANDRVCHVRDLTNGHSNDFIFEVWAAARSQQRSRFAARVHACGRVFEGAFLSPSRCCETATCVHGRAPGGSPGGSLDHSSVLDYRPTRLGAGGILGDHKWGQRGEFCPVTTRAVTFGSLTLARGPGPSRCARCGGVLGLHVRRLRRLLVGDELATDEKTAALRVLAVAAGSNGSAGTAGHNPHEGRRGSRFAAGLGACCGSRLRAAHGSRCLPRVSPRRTQTPPRALSSTEGNQDPSVYRLK